MSALLPAVDDPNWAEFPRLEARYEAIRPIDGPSIEQLLGAVDREFVEMAPLLRISPPKVSLVENHRGLTAGANG
jgi:hypothetical protein